jgi:hypothetical protein
MLRLANNTKMVFVIKETEVDSSKTFIKLERGRRRIWRRRRGR